MTDASVAVRRLPSPAGLFRAILRGPLALLRLMGGFFAGLGLLGAGLLALVIVLFTGYFTLLGYTGPIERGESVPLSEVIELVDERQVTGATLYDEDARVIVETLDGRELLASYPQSDIETSQLIRSVQEAGAEVVVDQQPRKALLKFVVQYLFPLVILAALFGLVFLVTSGKSGASEFSAFSKLRGGKAKVAPEAMTFDRVAGAGEAVVELREVVDYLKDPSKYAKLGARAPKGVLLVGPPGTGKTLLAKAVAGEAGVPFFSLSGSDFVESLVGVGAARVRDLFKQAREAAPSIIFIDEIDAAGRQRGAGMGQGNDEREQTLNQMLVEMDGFSAAQGIAVLAATNRPDILDAALLRPGRFDRQVVVDPPDVDGRVDILQLYLDKKPLAADADVRRIAQQTPGFTGAELANLVNEASLVSVRKGHDQLTMQDLEEAVDRVVAGPQRRSHVLSDAEKRLVAYHEAGHAVVAAALGMETAVQKLSIVARGRTLGHTTTYQITDRVVLTESDLRRQLITSMGGLAVESIVFDEISTGSENDLHTATALARTMVANLGMGTGLGRVAVGQKSGEVFLGRDFTKMQEISPATLEAVDREIRELLATAEQGAITILEGNAPSVEAIATRLIEHETFSGPELDAVLGQVNPADPATYNPQLTGNRRAGSGGTGSTGT